MLYNPFMPSVKLNSRITFGGGGGDAPAPVVAPPPVAVTPPPPPPPEFTSTYPELANQRFSTEEAKTTAEAAIDKQKTDASTAVAGAIYRIALKDGLSDAVYATADYSCNLINVDGTLGDLKYYDYSFNRYILFKGSSCWN